MRTYEDIARQIGKMKPGQCLNVPFNDVPQIPDFLCRDGRSPVDEILQLVVGASFNILPTFNGEANYYRFYHLPEEHCLDNEGDVRTWVYYDRRKYFEQGDDGFWYKNHAPPAERHRLKVAEHLARRQPAPDVLP